MLGKTKHLKEADFEPLQMLHREWGKSHILIAVTSLETWDDERCRFLATRDKEEYRIPCRSEVRSQNFGHAQALEVVHVTVVFPSQAECSKSKSNYMLSPVVQNLSRKARAIPTCKALNQSIQGRASTCVFGVAKQ